MAKMFAKIAKTFVGLSATIVAKGRRLFLILHFEAKYAKIDCKNEIYAKNWVRRTWTEKVNSGKVNGQSQRSKVNGQRSTLGQSQRSVNGQKMTSLDDVAMTSAEQWMLTQLGLTWQAR